MGCRDICPVLGEDLTEQHIVRGVVSCCVLWCTVIMSMYVESVFFSPFSTAAAVL